MQFHFVLLLKPYAEQHNLFQWTIFLFIRYHCCTLLYRNVVCITSTKITEKFLITLYCDIKHKNILHIFCKHLTICLGFTHVCLGSTFNIKMIIMKRNFIYMLFITFIFYFLQLLNTKLCKNIAINSNYIFIFTDYQTFY